MSIEVVVGANWGDEGKGRMVDYLAQQADYVVRYQGGNNAGHTVVNDHGTFKLHLLPSGVFNPHAMNVLGPGMVVDIEALADEIEQVRAAGLSDFQLCLSERATICFPFHRLQDGWEEERLGQHAYGSTRRGIAPAYGDRTMKKAVQVGELLHPDRLRAHLQRIVEWKNLTARGVYGIEEPIKVDEVLDWACTNAERVKPLICDTVTLLDDAARTGKTILLEAQLGSLRDLNFGIYPFTTSSCTLASYAPIGAGMFGHPPDRVLAVMKAFSTCVGEGPFVTRMNAEEADQLREVAHEYGAATGRPRTVGHFDAIASRYGVHVQGATEVAMTKLDSLSGRDRLKVCIDYEYQGQRLGRFPLNAVLEEAVPIYEELPGWQEDIGGVRQFNDLPKAAQDYVLYIEKLVECPIRYVSVGPERDALITRG